MAASDEDMDQEVEIGRGEFKRLGDCDEDELKAAAILLRDRAADLKDED